MLDIMQQHAVHTYEATCSGYGEQMCQVSQCVITNLSVCDRLEWNTSMSKGNRNFVYTGISSGWTLSLEASSSPLLLFSAAWWVGSMILSD